MKYICFLIIVFAFQNSEPAVKVSGQMRRIMQSGDLSANISLDTLQAQSHLYGLGVVEGLKGEIIILDSQPYVTSVDNDSLKTKKTFTVKASLLVYSQISSWTTCALQSPIETIADLQVAIEKATAQSSFSNGKPFPFLIKLRHPGTINYHVIDWKGGVVHTPDNHKKFAKVERTDTNGAVLLGFYSRNHHGVFTHHESNIHIHVLRNNIVGHVDNIKVTGEIELSIPD